MNMRIGAAAVGCCLPLLGVVVAGCATIDPRLEEEIAVVAAPLAPASTDDDAVVAAARGAADGDVAQPEAVAVPTPASIEGYISLALSRHPAIHGAIRDIERLGYRVAQVGSLDDPMIEVMPPTGDMTETAAGMLDAGVGLRQTIPWPGKLQRRADIAEHDVRIAFARLADLRLQIAVAVARSYYDFYLATVSSDIARQAHQLLASMREVAAARYRTGAATQQDVLRAEVESYAVAAEIIDHEQRRRSARANLNGLLHRPADAPLPAPSAVPLESVSWRLDVALALAAESNPRLAAVREEARRRLSEIELAELEAYPDLRLGFTYNFIGAGISPVATGDDNWSLPLAMNLPIWRERLRAKVLEANASALKSVEAYAEIRSLVAVGIQDALARIDASYRRARILRDLIEPRSLQAVDVSTAAYRVGAVEFTTLLESWRAWLGYSMEYHQALAELERRFADLRMLVGARIPRAEEAAS